MSKSLRIISLALVLSLAVVGASLVSAAEHDLGGQTVRIASYLSNEMINYFGEGEGRGVVQQVEDMFGVKLEFVYIPWDGGPDAIMSSVLAGDPVGDIFVVTNRWIPILAGNNALLAMDHILDEDYYQSLPGMHPQMRETYSSYQGKAYGISVNGSFQRNMDIGASQGWIYNRDIFAKAGLVTPNELLKTNEWTWATMQEAAIKLTEDTNGDGQIDQWGVGGRLDPWPIEQEMATYANGGGIMKERDGKMVFALADEDSVEAMQLWRDLVQVEGVVMIGDKYDVRTEFNKKTLTQFRLDLLALPDHANVVDFDYGYVFFPKGPRAQDYVNPVWGMDVALLPITSEEPEVMVEIVNALFQTTGEYRDLSEYENDFLEFFMQSVRDRASLEVIRQMLYKVRLWDNIPNLSADLDLRLRQAWGEAALGKESPKSVMDAIAPAMQAVIDQIYNK